MNKIVISSIAALVFATSAVAANYTGTDGPDFFAGTSNDDVASMHAGVDYAYGLGGHDTIFGGQDHDLISGDCVEYGSSCSGVQDELHGDDGDDTIYGDGGNDFIYGGSGHDGIDAGSGNDTIAIRDNQWDALGSCGGGFDIVYADPSDAPFPANCEDVRVQ